MVLWPDAKRHHGSASQFSYYCYPLEAKRILRVTCDKYQESPANWRVGLLEYSSRYSTSSLVCVNQVAANHTLV
jgi:hypothetical protein